MHALHSDQFANLNWVGWISFSLMGNMVLKKFPQKSQQIFNRVSLLIIKHLIWELNLETHLKTSNNIEYVLSKGVTLPQTIIIWQSECNLLRLTNWPELGLKIFDISIHFFMENTFTIINNFYLRAFYLSLVQWDI
jgi:hypothetical protein